MQQAFFNVQFVLEEGQIDGKPSLPAILPAE